MDNLRQFSGENETQIWQQIAADMQNQGEILTYSAQINQQNHQIFFDIDIDLGGGFEGGFETTTFMAPVENTTFRFHLHPQNFLNEVGKMLGMEDIELNYPAFDEAFILKTNQPETLKALFSDATLRQTLLKFKEADLKLSPEHDELDSRSLLTFSLDHALTNPEDLREVYSMMLRILQQLEKPV